MINWNNIENTALSRFEEALCHTRQSPMYHEEGDVYIHTMIMLDALTKMPEYQALGDRQRHILNVAAMLHDIGKIPTTVFEDGDWHSPHHAPTGSRMARELLWKEYGLCGQKELVEVREAICLLIRYHSFPPVAIELEHARMRLHRMAADSLLVPDFSIKMLCILSKADMLGRKCADQQALLEKIALCEELAKEEGCHDEGFPFPSAHTRRAYLSGHDVWKEQDLYDDTWGEVTLMCGLPGTGKDTWIRRHLSDLPVISLDEIRRIHKIPPTAGQGGVAHIAREQAKAHLRNRQPFVWNATNVTPRLRESLISLFESYRARVRIVYLETGWQTMLDRNCSREAVVPQPAIDTILSKLSLPETYEARTVEWLYV